MNGRSAKAAESGLGWWARLAARSQSPEPQYSGANHRKALSADAADHASARPAGLAPLDREPQPVEARRTATPRGAAAPRRSRAGTRRCGGRRGGARSPTGRRRRAAPRSCRGRSCARTRRPAAASHAAIDAGGAAAEPRAEPVGHRDRQQPAGARDEQPQLGRGVVAEQRERRREEDRQRLPRRPARSCEVEVRDLAAPDDPRPRVVGRRRTGRAATAPRARGRRARAARPGRAGPGAGGAARQRAQARQAGRGRGSRSRPEIMPAGRVQAHVADADRRTTRSSTGVKPRRS